MRLLIAISISAIGLATLRPLSGAPVEKPSDTLDERGLINGLVPVMVTLGSDGEIAIFGEPLVLEKARERLVAIGKANPAQPVLIVADDKIPPELVREITELCKTSHLTHIVRIKREPVSFPPLPSQGPKPAA